MLGGFAYAAPAPSCCNPDDLGTMSDNKPARKRQARNWARVVAGRKQASYWRRRWEIQPEPMRSNLDRINRTRKEKADERTQRLKAILANCPAEIESWNLRKCAEEAIVKAGFTVQPNSLNVLVSAARRRGLIRFDPERLVWMILKFA